jgi:hypothetical protein
MKRAHVTALLMWMLVGSLDAAESGAKGEPLRFTTDPDWRKTTVEECRVRGGEYVGSAALRSSDIVNCFLPHKIRELGDVPAAPAPRHILASVYDYLYRPSIETPGYGLYSYVLLPAENSRGKRLMEEIFHTTSFVSLGGMKTERLNLVYLPTRAGKLKALVPLVASGEAPEALRFSRDFYDYSLARTLLVRICDAIADAAQAACSADPSLGPYIFTFTQPVSGLERVPPPFLFVDLSNVHERAFGEFVAAYKEQVRQPQFSERDRIDTFRLRMLSVVLTSSDWLRPVLGGAPQTATLIE